MPLFSSNMSSSQDTFTMSGPNSPPPPQDMTSYMRMMHQHTKRQIDAMARSQGRRSRSNHHNSHSNNSNNSNSHTTPSMPNGVSSGSSSTSSNDYAHHH